MLSARFCWRRASRSLQSTVRHNGTTPILLGALNAAISRYDTSSEALKTIAIKDNIVTKDLPTTAASGILAGYTSPFDATVVKLLRHNGYSIISKTNLDEFGMGSHTKHSAAGPTLNPYSRGGVRLSPGGSSGGSAVEVAAGQSWAALGTDTGGSVRLPAAYTGTVGFKPSYGLLSRWGVIQYANSLDTVGILAKTVRDVRNIFSDLNKYDEQDPTSLPPSIRNRISTNPHHRSSTLRVGIPTEYNITELHPLVRSAYTRTLQHLQSAGHKIAPISLPTTKEALSTYYVLAPAEASSNLAKYDGVRYGQRTRDPDSLPKENLPLYAKTRGEGFGEEVRRRILLGAYTLSSESMDNYFIQAQKVRRLVQRDFDSVFALRNPLLDDHVDRYARDGQGVDVIVTPTAPTLPVTVEEVKQQSSIESYMNDVFTVPASLAGLPAISVPIRLVDEEAADLEETDVRSVGVQILGQFGDDENVLNVARLIEEQQGR
ncbi:hypothetical protein LTR62_004120 [Meristemomyces frigidus]|uniref:Glutamyl-tRNA(Gln) amidotransferase subunit A, mitochondrial n=1 Tax=Meristemomyces frigidus TaxID=1508187 RepID=A0AAN7YSG7_9PEZI|nr:hypothetical protein LTR62_004120 [Meristemomyces frigidus]